MLSMEFDIQRIYAYITEVESKITDYTNLWRDFIAPLVIGEIAEVFETEGRGEWPPLDPRYAAEKEITHPGKTILRREDNYIQAATSTSHPGNIARFSPTEMIWGVDGGYFEAQFGFNYPEYHEIHAGDKARPVFELVTVGGRLDENIEKLTEKWMREELAEIEQRI